MWIDSHCHLDAAEFDADRDAVVARAGAAGVGLAVLPAVVPANFDRVRELAHRHSWVYALGIHPLYVEQAGADAVDQLDAALARHARDPRLVAVGEIGLDFFVPGLDRAGQELVYEAQLQLARRYGLPVILHVRRSSDRLLKYLRRHEVPGGIAHAFNGSLVQAGAFVDRGFCLGFGGSMTFERALQIRSLATRLPEVAVVLETDAPDIPPQWLYRTAAQRAPVTDEAVADGLATQAGGQGRNEPAELPRIAATLAALRGRPLDELAACTTANVLRVLPRVAAAQGLGCVPLAERGLRVATG
jgi:TatD DNase family protein